MVSVIKIVNKTCAFKPVLSCFRCASSTCKLEIKDVISKITEVSNESLTPEIHLRLITDRCPLWSARRDEQDLPFQDPFWAFYWPGGQGLSRYILDNPSLFRCRAVLDVGCGCGAGAISAAVIGASRVTANDVDQCALVATEMNAIANGVVTIETCSENLIGSSTDCDVILLGDMLYDDTFSAEVRQWANKLTREGKLVLVGDPGRPPISQSDWTDSLELLETYRLPRKVVMENPGFSETSVHRFKVKPLYTALK